MIVTGDQDLLVLHPLQEIAILNPAQAVQRLQKVATVGFVSGSRSFYVVIITFKVGFTRGPVEIVFAPQLL